MCGLEQGMDFIKIDVDQTQGNVNKVVEDFNEGEDGKDERRRDFYENLGDAVRMIMQYFRGSLMAMHKIHSMASSHNELGGDPSGSQAGSGRSVASGGQRGMVSPTPTSEPPIGQRLWKGDRALQPAKMPTTLLRWTFAGGGYGQKGSSELDPRPQ
jgi:hypothetical protein